MPQRRANIFEQRFRQTARKSLSHPYPEGQAYVNSNAIRKQGQVELSPLAWAHQWERKSIATTLIRANLQGWHCRGEVLHRALLSFLKARHDRMFLPLRCQR
jgi:hypothetical protein